MITWHTMQDDHVCQVCKVIEGYTWVFEVGQNELQGELTHPSAGVVWTVDQGSAAHGHRGNCRCHLTYEIDVADIVKKVEEIHQICLEMVSEPKGA